MLAHDRLRQKCPPQRYPVIDNVNELLNRLVRMDRRLTIR